MKTVNNNIGKKQVSINLIANIVSFSANLIISFVLTPFLINTLGKETFSFYPIANTIVSYMSVLTTAMNTIASRYVTISLVNGKQEEATKYYSSVLTSNLLISAVLFIPMILVVIFIDRFMEVPINSVAAIKTLYAFVFSAALINIAASVFGIATFAKNRIDLRSLRELITAALRLVLFVILYKLLPPSIVYVGIVTLAVAIVNIIFQMKYSKMLLPEIKLSFRNTSWKHTKELLASSIWNVINSFGNTLLAGMSLILANIFYGATASGSYSIIQTVPQFLNGAIIMLVGVFYPVITYKYAQNDKKGLIDELRKAQRTIGFITGATITVFSALASDFFSLWTPGEDSSYLAMLSLLTILPHFIIGCMWSLTNLNVVMNRVKIPAMFTLSCGILNIIISYVIFKGFHPGLILLPVVSTMLQLMWIGIFIPLYACHNLGVKWNTFYQAVTRAFICAVPVFIIVYKLKNFFIFDNWYKFILFGGCSGIIALVIFGVGMFGRKEIKNLLINIFKKVRK